MGGVFPPPPQKNHLPNSNGSIISGMRSGIEKNANMIWRAHKYNKNLNSLYTAGWLFLQLVNVFKY